MRKTLACLLALALAIPIPSAMAQSAVEKAIETLATFGDIKNIEGRWIWANMTTLLDPDAPDGGALTDKMVRFCPEESGPIMAITAVGTDGFDIGIVNLPPAMHWQFRRDRSGRYSQDIDIDAFFAAMGHGPDDKRSAEQVAFLERNNGPVTVIRSAPNVLLITNRNGYDLFVRCDD